MQIWMSSESSKEVLNEDQLAKLNLARNTVEHTLKNKLQDKQYNIPLDSWDCITVMMGANDFGERITYSVKKRSMDFRLKIDPVVFNTTDDLGRQKLIFVMLMRSLDLLKEKFEKVKPKLDGYIYEELERLRSDALDAARNEGWL